MKPDPPAWLTGWPFQVYLLPSPIPCPYMPGALYAPAFVAAALVLVPLPGHWRARNIPTLSIISWLFILNVSYGVNAVVWAGNTDLVLPVWCDIG